MKDRVAKIKVSETEDLVKKLKDEFEKDQDHWSDIYKKAREDLKFTSDEPDAQWDEQHKSSRIKNNRPALTVDQLSQFIHQVVNDIRMNTPSINIIPAGGGADKETAEVFKGLIRNIEYVSNADDVYDTASLNSVKCSIGFIRVDHDYIDEESFDQQLLIKRVINPLGVFLDRDSIEADGRDAKRATVLDKLQVADFKKQYPGKTPVCFQSKDNSEKKDEDYITIAEMFVIDEESKTVGLLEDGNMEEMAEGQPYKSTRKMTKRVVKRYKLSGQDVLEQTTFPGKYIPLVPVYGEEAWVDGKRHVYSLIRRSKDAQRLYNFMKSNEIEVLMSQPKAPWMGAEGQFANRENWLNPGNSDILEYKTTDLMGNPVTSPQRVQPPTIPTGFFQAGIQAVDDIKATLGMYNASIGQRSNETSGKAIQARQQEGDVATFHFGDNLTRSVGHVGRILVCAAPEIYDTERVIRIIGEEDDPKEVGINGAAVEDQTQQYDLTKGKYDVKVTTGPAFSTRRQETVAMLGELFQKQPELMPIMGDLYFENSDFSGSIAMASRMKKAMDPKYLDKEEREKIEQEGGSVDPEKEQMKVLMQQMQQELASLQADAQNKQGELMIKQGDLQIKEQEVQLKAEELQLKKAELGIKAQESVQNGEIEKERIKADVTKSRHSAMSSASPDALATTDELSETGVSPVTQVVTQLSEAIAVQSQAMVQGLTELAQSQQQLGMVLVEGNKMIASAISQPKAVVYDQDGRILGVK
jgi:hypothetical protein